jgi:carbamoyltransferase
MRAVLGLKLSPWHDTGAAIVFEEGPELRVVAISQERLDRVKNSRAFPEAAINYCLDMAHCRLTDLSLVVCDFIVSPRAKDSFLNFPDARLPEKLAFFEYLEKNAIPTLFAEHHLCHIASAYFSAGWDDAVGLVIDGHGSFHETQTIFNCEGRSISKLTTSHSPGIGWMYSAVTEIILGFGHLQEGKTMGLAGWVNHSRLGDHILTPEAKDGGPHETVYQQFANYRGDDGPWELAAPVGMRRRGAHEDPISYADYAFAAQKELERSVLAVAGYARTVSPKKRLCYSGGVALNILANRLLIESGLFEDIFIQPAASDSGIPLGAALLGYYTAIGGTRRWQMDHAFLAKEYSCSEIEDAVKGWPGEIAIHSVQSLAQCLAHDYLLGWFQGASELGPRALGHRSILCSPRQPRMKEYLNQEVKHREMFRPFAPIVLAERQGEYFDLRVPSPYMLVNSEVLAGKQELMPAVVHADGTARVQSITQTSQPALHALLSELENVNHIPVLLNTSLNLAGEPIIETPREAVDLLARSQLDALVIGPYILSKRPLDEMRQYANPRYAAFSRSE